MHDIGAVGPALKVEAQLNQGGVKFDVGLPKHRLRRQAHLQRRRRVLADRGYLHLGTQRLSECGLHIEAPQAGCMCTAGDRKAESQNG